MCYTKPCCWTELSIRRSISDAPGYNRRFAVNRRSSIEVRNPKGTQLTTFRIVIRAVGKEEEDPSLTPSEKCKEKLRRARHSLDLSITYWLEQSPTEKVSRELLPITIRDNFEAIHNRIRAQKGLKPVHYVSVISNVLTESTASMEASTVKKIIAYAKKVHSDKTRKEEILTFFRAGVLVPEDAYFHWYKIYEILRDPSLKIIRQVQNQRNTCIVPGVEPWFLHDAPQPHRHIEENATDAQDNLNQRAISGDYLSHLRPIIEHYIENF